MHRLLQIQLRTWFTSVYRVLQIRPVFFIMKARTDKKSTVRSLFSDFLKTLHEIVILYPSISFYFQLSARHRIIWFVLPFRKFLLFSLLVKVFQLEIICLLKQQRDELHQLLSIEVPCWKIAFQNKLKKSQFVLLSLLSEKTMRRRVSMSLLSISFCHQINAC